MGFEVRSKSSACKNRGSSLSYCGEAPPEPRGEESGRKFSACRTRHVFVYWRGLIGAWQCSVYSTCLFCRHPVESHAS